jgi:hypothetical protein
MMPVIPLAATAKNLQAPTVFRGQIAWEGEVEVFDLTGYPKAKRCYAWGYPNDKQPDALDVVTVLELPPVVSPETAVKVAIASSVKR